MQVYLNPTLDPITKGEVLGSVGVLREARRYVSVIDGTYRKPARVAVVEDDFVIYDRKATDYLALLAQSISPHKERTHRSTDGRAPRILPPGDVFDRVKPTLPRGSEQKWKPVVEKYWEDYHATPSATVHRDHGSIGTVRYAGSEQLYDIFDPDHYSRFKYDGDFRT
jgi:hypothetical protein